MNKTDRSIRIIKQSIEIAESIMPTVYDARKKNKVFHFAFGFKKKQLIGIGLNRPEKPNHKALKLSKKFKTSIEYPYLHAETDLISRLWGKYYIDGNLKVVVLKINKFNEIGNSKPCKRCMKILNSLGIYKIWWSSSKGGFADRNGDFICLNQIK